MTAHDSWAKVYDLAYQESFGGFYKRLTELTLSVIQEEISKESKIHFDKLKKALEFNNIDYEVNPKLVRGLYYYCETVFEFKTKNLGSQDTLIGGGRYDGLIKLLGGPDIPGIGWAAGIERISLLMNLKKISDKKVHLAINDKKFINHLLKIIKSLKDSNLPYFWNYKYNLKKSLSKANLDNAKFILIIGEREFENDNYNLRKLDTGEQFEIKINEINKYIQ